MRLDIDVQDDAQRLTVLQVQQEKSDCGERSLGRLLSLRFTNGWISVQARPSMHLGLSIAG